LHQVSALAHLREGAWDAAGQALKRAPAPAAGENDRATVRIAKLVTRGRQLPRKSPWLAGGLSALVPGAGKACAGRFSDGLYSLALVGSASWFAYRDFEDDGASSVKGGLFGSVGAVLYAGNIYGSVVAVRANRAHRRRLEERLYEFIEAAGRFLPTYRYTPERPE